MDKLSKAPPALPIPPRRMVLFQQQPGQIAAVLAAGAMLTRQPPRAVGEPEERRQPQVGGRGARNLAITPDSYDADARTVEAVLSAGTAVRRYYFTEELEISAEAIDLARVAGGVCPLLDSHNQYQLDGVIGRVVSTRVENDQLIGVLAFADTPAGRDIEARVASGELRAISIGYRVTRWQITATDETDHETWRAVAWELLEASLVSVPADPNAVVRSASGPTMHGSQEDEDMRRNLPGGAAAAASSTSTAAIVAATTEPASPSEPAAPAQPQAAATVNADAVRTAARNAGLDSDATIELIGRHADSPFTSDALMADIGRRFAQRDSGAATVNRINVTRDAGDTVRAGMTAAMIFRLSPGSQLPEVAREFRGMSLLDMSRELLTSQGQSVRGLTPNEIADRSLHTTSDLPALMGNAMNRRLRQSYEENRPSYQRWARRAPNAPNFKSIDVVQMSALPDLLRVNEGGEVKYGSISDGVVSYKVLTYSRAIGISRQTIVNDDLRALERITSGFAGSASRLENRTVYAQITANANMPDGVALFHATHGNLAVAAGAPSAATLAAGRTAMRLQKGLQDEELNLMPEFLLVPASLEQVAYQFTSSQFIPEKATDINEFRAGGRTALEPIVEALLDGVSATSWYLLANNGAVDTVEWCYLDGAEGPQIASRMGFTVDGVEMKATLDFAAAPIDHRGMFKNAG